VALSAGGAVALSPHAPICELSSRFLVALYGISVHNSIKQRFMTQKTMTEKGRRRTMMQVFYRASMEQLRHG
jgi:hypothetical protein